MNDSIVTLDELAAEAEITARFHYSVNPKNPCFYCNAKHAKTKDHFIPRRLGGSNSCWNIVRSCQPCNASKGHKLPTAENVSKLLRLFPNTPFKFLFLPNLIGEETAAIMKPAWDAAKKKLNTDHGLSFPLGSKTIHEIEPLEKYEL